MFIIIEIFWKTKINWFFSTFSKGIWTQPEFVMDILTAMVVKMKQAAFANLGSTFAAGKEPKVGYEFTKFLLFQKCNAWIILKIYS